MSERDFSKLSQLALISHANQEDYLSRRELHGPEDKQTSFSRAKEVAWKRDRALCPLPIGDPWNGESPPISDGDWSSKASIVSTMVPDDSISIRSIKSVPTPRKFLFDPRSTSTKFYQSSNNTNTQRSIGNLPFVEKLPHIGGLAHYRLILSVDKEMATNRIETAFGHVFLDQIEKQCSSTNVDNKPAQTNGVANQGQSQGQGSGSGSSKNGGGQNGKRTENGDQGVGARSRPRPGIPVPIGSPEYPPEPQNSPETYRNDWFEIKKSPIAGYGAFALQNLKWNQTILAEEPIFHANTQTLYQELDKLSPSDKQAFDRMHGHPPGNDPDYPKSAAIFKTNSFQTFNHKQGVFLRAARFNHACPPKNNVMYRYDRTSDRMVLTTQREIAAGVELKITYCPTADPEVLFETWGFVCRCGACNSLTEEQIDAIRNPRVV